MNRQEKRRQQEHRRAINNLGAARNHILKTGTLNSQPNETPQTRAITPQSIPIRLRSIESHISANTSGSTEAPATTLKPWRAFRETLNLAVKKSWPVGKWVIGALVTIGLALWQAYPKVTIDVSDIPAAGAIGSQVTFNNQNIYAVKINLIEADPIVLNRGMATFGKGLGLQYIYTNTEIYGRDFVTIDFDRMFGFLGQTKAPDLGSVIMIKIEYELPIIKKQVTDESLFEMQADRNGSPKWIKRPLGKYATFKSVTALRSAGD